MLDERRVKGDMMLVLPIAWPCDGKTIKNAKFNVFLAGEGNGGTFFVLSRKDVVGL